MTTIVATALVALGSSAGWFSDPKPSPKTAKVQAAAAAPALDDHNAALLYLAAVAGAQAEPNVRTETVYQYVDAPPSAPAPAAKTNTSAPVAAPVTAPTAPPPVQAASEPTAPPAAAPPQAAPTAPPPPPAPKPAEPKPAPGGDGGDD
jgi:hypothetical protein